MEVFEFQSVTSNGVLQIPKKYQKSCEGKAVRVVVLPSTKKVNSPKKKQTLLSKLREIKISAPKDFSENIDDYLNGEKSA